MSPTIPDQHLHLIDQTRNTRLYSLFTKSLPLPNASPHGIIIKPLHGQPAEKPILPAAVEDRCNANPAVGFCCLWIDSVIRSLVISYSDVGVEPDAF